MPVSLRKGNFWQPKLRTGAAMVRLCCAQLLVDWVSFDQWCKHVGFDADEVTPLDAAIAAEQLAADVEWAARRLPFETKCLPRAMALSWKLRDNRIVHSVVIAVRPHQLRQAPDALHAWVEVAGRRILGELPGPWIETARFGRQSASHGD